MIIMAVQVKDTPSLSLQLDKILSVCTSILYKEVPWMAPVKAKVMHFGDASDGCGGIFKNTVPVIKFYKTVAIIICY